MAKAPVDAVMLRVKAVFAKSGLTLHELGVKMGYPEEMARKSTWQFMRSADPRISMVRRFASAMGVPLTELVEGARKKHE